LNVAGLLRIELDAGFIFQHFVDRRLRPLDLGREDGFLIRERREHDAGIDDALQ